jgi:hypothetical protein
MQLLISKVDKQAASANKLYDAYLLDAIRLIYTMRLSSTSYKCKAMTAH